MIPESVAGLRIEISVRRAGARSLEEDLCRRDFSLNAIAFDPQSGSYLDPLDGRGDLASRRLRAVDTERAFRDDAIRILRGVLKNYLGLISFLLQVRPGRYHLSPKNADLRNSFSLKHSKIIPEYPNR